MTSRGPNDWQDDPIDDLARQLRESVGSEFRIEAEIVEHETETGRLRKRTLADAARDAAHRGDTVSVVLTGRTITGIATHVGRDYLTLETEAEIADVRLAGGVMTIRRAVVGGRSVGGGSVTFRARLSEFEQTGERVTVIAGSILTGGAPLTLDGTITIVAEDHVDFRDLDHVHHYIPTERIDLVVRPRSLR